MAHFNGTVLNLNDPKAVEVNGQIPSIPVSPATPKAPDLFPGGYKPPVK